MAGTQGAGHGQQHRVVRLEDGAQHARHHRHRHDAGGQHGTRRVQGHGQAQRRSFQSLAQNARYGPAVSGINAEARDTEAELAGH